MARLIETILIICAITMSGGYDCDEKWVLIQEDGYGVWDPTGVFVKGVSVYDPYQYSIYDSYPELQEQGGYGSYPWMAYGGRLAHDNCWSDRMTDEPENCLPVIWHEIKHQQCKCNWHKDLIKTFKSFKGTFGGL